MTIKEIRALRKKLKAIDDSEVSALLSYIARLEYDLARARATCRGLETRLSDVEAIEPNRG
jgi:hypothetical protein